MGALLFDVAVGLAIAGVAVFFLFFRPLLRHLREAQS